MMSKQTSTLGADPIKKLVAVQSGDSRKVDHFSSLLCIMEILQDINWISITLSNLQNDENDHA